MTKFLDKLDGTVKKNNSLLCVGLDIDMKKIPISLLNKEDPIFNFNKAIIDATKDLVCSYKPNIAFYEMYGTYGIEALIRTIEYAGQFAPVILDAKRGDIGHTASAYVKSIFEIFKADATTVSPYLGHDSLQPFIEHKDKGIFVLCLTSNPGSKDFQMIGKDEPLYKTVARKVKDWNKGDNLGLVVGATNPAELKSIRDIAGNMPLLIPGIGAQGGDLLQTVKNGVNRKGERAIINSSRGIIYASQKEDFAGTARIAARKLKEEINSYRFVG
ncbi:orotidine-5'-phosphate decarboxylase [Candidatus Margulisiibacteriota bacterium]